MYKVFVRNWYKVINGQIRPDLHARKTTLAHVSTEVEARAICKEYNDTHTPGVKSRKAEYTRVS